MKFVAHKSPGEEQSLTNKIYFNQRDLDNLSNYVRVHTESGSYVFYAESSAAIPEGSVGFGLIQRKWANISLNQPLSVEPFTIDMQQGCLATAVLSIDFFSKSNARSKPIDADAMAREFTMQFVNIPLTVGQLIMYIYGNVRPERCQDGIIVTEYGLVEYRVAVDMLSDTNSSFVGWLVTDTKQGQWDTSRQGIGKRVPETYQGQLKDAKYWNDLDLNCGKLISNTVVRWENKPESRVMLTGDSTTSQSIISLNWDFNQLGIGGLDREFSNIFRRTFASRMFPPGVAVKLGIKHIRGMLLYGPPGTGKTLMARQIGQMISSRPPKIVNGPSILDKYVGESEANIRKLFAEAEEEEKRLGENSALHIIIFDEIDAICKTRGSVASGAGVHDTVVNQLLTKMDGVDQLNNILVIGMTNRKDMIDEALLRPGRFEVQMEISLPDEEGRLQILQIHTSKINKAQKLAGDVNLPELAHKTKNFSGAELEGLCRAATFTAMYKQISASKNSTLNPDAAKNILVTREDFYYALENDIKPAFGTSEEELICYAPRGIMLWGDTVSEAFKMADLSLRAVTQPDYETYRPLTLLLTGPPKAGKTAMAVEIAKRSKFPYVKIIASHKMIGYTELAKCHTMKKIFDDGAKCPFSVIIIDSIEDLIEYNPVGPRFSNFIVQAIRDLLVQPLKAGRRMLVLGTTSCREQLAEQNLTRAFSWHIRISPMTQPQHIMSALEEDKRFSPSELEQIERSLSKQEFLIGIKHLLELVDLSINVDPEYRVSTFLKKLHEECFLTPPSGFREILF